MHRLLGMLFLLLRMNRIQGYKLMIVEYYLDEKGSNRDGARQIVLTVVMQGRRSCLGGSDGGASNMVLEDDSVVADMW